MIHEQNGVLGRVNTLFAKRVDHVACGTWPTELPDGRRGRAGRQPGAARGLDRAGAGYIPPGDYPMSILVIGGSQGARILSDVVPAGDCIAASGYAAHLRVSHQARDEDGERVAPIIPRTAIMPRCSRSFRMCPPDERGAARDRARGRLQRGGYLGDRAAQSILIPYAAAGDHQTANARGLVEAGAAIRHSRKENLTVTRWPSRSASV